jgi:hypothetical protein
MGKRRMGRGGRGVNVPETEVKGWFCDMGNGGGRAIQSCRGWDLSDRAILGVSPSKVRRAKWGQKWAKNGPKMGIPPGSDVHGRMRLE